VPWALCLVLTCISAALGFRAFGTTSGDASAPKVDPAAVAQATRPVPAGAPGYVVLESKGYIIPVHQIQVSPKVSGMVMKLNFEEGKHVTKGEILAELETVDYQADRDHARSQLNSNWQRFLELYTGSRPEEIKQAKAELEENDAQREQLYLDWKRSLTLNRQALAQRDYEAAYGSYKMMERKVERMRQAYELMLIGPRVEKIDAAWHDVLQADADLAKAQWRLENCIVRAPIAGTILTKKAEEGNIVNPIAFNISASLCEMADLSDLEVDMNIQERDVATVFKGQKCQIRSEAFPDREYTGFVSRLMPIADRAKGAVPVRVKVNVAKEEEGSYLKPDMSVLVRFLKK